jgi:hypothetical protein
VSEYLQKEGLIGKKEYQKMAIDGLLLDPLQVNSFLKLYDFIREKAIPKYRETAFNKMLENENYIRENDVIFMKGAEYNETEKQTADKLTKAGFYVVFPSSGQIKAIKKIDADESVRKNDVYIYDKKTYNQRKVDLKTVRGASLKTIINHIASGSGQAPVVVLDITGNISKHKLIDAIRSGWTKNTKTILLNYKGQWHEIDKKRAYDKHWMKANIK